MIQKVSLEDEIVSLDSERLYSGAQNLDDAEKKVRKAIGLPVTKQLVYYKDIHDSKSAVAIKKYRLAEMYEISDRWYTVEIVLDDESVVRIHSYYLAEMQKPSFVSDSGRTANQGR